MHDTHTDLSGLLNNQGRRFPLALVTQWTCHSVRILCPYCLCQHKHWVGNPPWTGQTCVSHCFHKGPHQYQICYPYENPAKRDYAYEIDKDEHCFVTIGVPKDEEEEEEQEKAGSVAHQEEQNYGRGSAFAEPGLYKRDGSLEEVQEELSQMNFHDSQTKQPSPPPGYLGDWEDRFQDPKLRLQLFFSHCVRNDISSVRGLLSRYGDPFVLSKNEDGRNCISLSAIQGHVQMTDFLFKNGGDLNNVNRKGRTPLMEAALWGRLETTELLLKNGADPNLKDPKGRKALFFAQPSKFTRILRERDGYTEDFKADYNRRIIAIRLQAFEPLMDDQTTDDVQEVQSGRFILERGMGQSQITYYERRISYNIPDESKTIAQLDRGRLFPIISSASGWRGDFAISEIIDNHLWMDRAMELCQLINYDLPADGRDKPGVPGSYYGSHAEKKLVAYYVDRHIVLPTDVISPTEASKTGDWTKEHMVFQDLANVQPTIATVRARLRVSREVCDDCRSFFKRIEEVLGIDVLVGHCQ